MTTTLTYSKTNPYPALLAERYRLTSTSSTRSTWHLVLDIRDSGISYKPGDAIGIFAENDANLVQRTLVGLGLAADELVQDRKTGSPVPAAHLLQHRLAITRGSRRILQILAAKSSEAQSSAVLQRLLDPNYATECDAYLEGRAVWDLLEDFPTRGSAQEILDALPVLNPRFYSIASSPLLNPDAIHLTVADVSYFAHGQERAGVCSRFLTNGVESGGSRVPIFLFPTARFVLPSPDVPILMIGPGTGIAPFRAFIQHRIAEGSKAPMWLFFGERNRDSDFYYQKELEEAEAQGLLHLTTAFSRDQEQKIYVQHRLLEAGAAVWSWIRKGAVIYVCGDAKVMAKDVQKAFLQIAIEHGGLSESEASEWLKSCKAQGQYREDVY
jgi:sulfite reductase (NADPH) flavoprotein alpha-component